SVSMRHYSASRNALSEAGYVGLVANLARPGGVPRFMSPTTGIASCCAPCRCTAEQADELATFQLIELHSIPSSQGRCAGYRIDGDQSAGIGALAQPAGSIASSDADI